MKVLFGVKFSSKLIEYYREKLPENIELIIPSDFGNETFNKLAPEIDIFIDYKITKEFLEKAKNLKHIQIPWTGSEKLDFALLKKYSNITVSNSHSNSLTIAEHAVALLMSAAKKIPYRDSYMRKGDWSPRYESRMYSSWVTGKTLGVIGYGAIGEKVAHILKHGFDMKILGLKRNPETIRNSSICDFLGGPEDLSYILTESDYIIISLPLTNETKGLIGKDQLEMMKNDAIIVNIARGPIIDEKALYQHLKKSNITLALDVWYNYPENWVDFSKVDKNHEPIFQNYPFQELENVIMSPHSAFKVKDVGVETSKDIINNIILVSKGETPKNLINLDLKY
ncbi:MAG: Glycerate dehydrogenase [Candidatus Heimdallarchaeota archaeon LC_3]|nr:MAG: Glycerate dehydrogenase [Candidatus Heimdallarchaeota archaeon LC_3]